jgi:retinol dehydrogenase-12
MFRNTDISISDSALPNRSVDMTSSLHKKGNYMFQTTFIQGINQPKILAEAEAYPTLKGKVVVISGATSGIGFQAALRFAEQGCFVIGIGRNEAKCRHAESRIRTAKSGAAIHYVLADLSLQEQIRCATDEISDILAHHNLDHVDVLINNAGTYGAKLTYTEEGYERTLAVNHLAPFLLTHELLPLLKQSADGHVLTVSSSSHYKTWLSVQRLNKPLLFNGLWAYKTTKLCNVLFTEAFNQHYGDSGVRAYAVDPGLVNTNIGFKGTGWLSSFVWRFRQHQGSSPDVPVQTMLRLARMENQYNTGTHYWKDCKPKTPSIIARSGKLAEELWQASKRWCGIE